MNGIQKKTEANGRKRPYMLVHRNQEHDTPLGLINLGTATGEDIVKFGEWVKDVLLWKGGRP